MRKEGPYTKGFSVGRRSFLVAAATVLGWLPAFSSAQDADGADKSARRGQRRKPISSPRLSGELAPFDALSLVLGRVTDRSASVSLLSRAPRELLLKWGETDGKNPRQSELLRLEANKPIEFQFNGLQPGRAYRYAAYERAADGSLREVRRACRLQTQRPPKSAFSFTIQGDSHPERPLMFDAALYARTLQLIEADHADFHICMGDDFSLNTLHDITEETVRSRYELQRPFLGLVGQSSPVFLLNGNHEQASLFNYNQQGMPHDAAVWAQLARNELFPQPTPDRFFTGNETPMEGIGPMRNYYAWTWGDALFVVLDNYWHSPACVDTQLREDDTGQKRGGKDRDWWGITLGDAQYQWFKKTLESSHAKFKFVFAHHVLGTGRGGIERAPFFEWGGKSNRGAAEFETHRKQWELPIHQLMVKAGVTIFFQGHDHLYARQELDGVVYQTCPVPADPNYAIYNDDRYLSGIKHPNSGYLRITVEPEKAKVQYVRSYLEDDNKSLNRMHGEITHEYIVQPKVSHE